MFYEEGTSAAAIHQERHKRSRRRILESDSAHLFRGDRRASAPHRGNKKKMAVRRRTTTLVKS